MLSIWLKLHPDLHQNHFVFKLGSSILQNLWNNFNPKTFEARPTTFPGQARIATTPNCNLLFWTRVRVGVCGWLIGMRHVVVVVSLLCTLLLASRVLPCTLCTRRVRIRFSVRDYSGLFLSVQITPISFASSATVFIFWFAIFLVVFFRFFWWCYFACFWEICKTIEEKLRRSGFPCTSSFYLAEEPRSVICFLSISSRVSLLRFWRCGVCCGFGGWEVWRNPFITAGAVARVRRAESCMEMDTKRWESELVVAAWCSDPSIQFVVGAMDKQSLLALFSGAANSDWSLEEDVQVFLHPGPRNISSFVRFYKAYSCVTRSCLNVSAMSHKTLDLGIVDD